MAELSIVIVNYKSAAFVEDCVQSINLFPPNTDTNIQIVDNSSEAIEFSSSSNISISKFDMPYNAGFARANNEGIRATTSDVVLLLNPDTLVEDDAIGECYHRFVNSSHVACGVQLLNADRTPQISGSRFIKGGINHFLPLPFLGKVVQMLGKGLKVKPTSVKKTSIETEVDWINGAFLMVKRSAIEKAGLLDEDFFLYAEEIEWCSRLRKVGTLCIYGDLHVIHLEGQSSNQSFGSSGKGYYNLYDKKGRQIMVSNFLRIRKQFGTGWFLMHLIAYLLTIPVFFIGLLIQKVFFIKGYSWKQFRGFCRNIGYLLSLSGKMIRNKPYFYKAV